MFALRRPPRSLERTHDAEDTVIALILEWLTGLVQDSELFHLGAHDPLGARLFRLSKDGEEVVLILDGHVEAGVVVAHGSLSEGLSG
jgi:hypothetical protein